MGLYSIMNFADFLLSSGVSIIDGAFSANGMKYFFINNDVFRVSQIGSIIREFKVSQSEINAIILSLR
jgi:hypothetical protein